MFNSMSNSMPLKKFYKSSYFRTYAKKSKPCRIFFVSPIFSRRNISKKIGGCFLLYKIVFTIIFNVSLVIINFFLNSTLLYKMTFWNSIFTHVLHVMVSLDFLSVSVVICTFQKIKQIIIKIYQMTIIQKLTPTCEFKTFLNITGEIFPTALRVIIIYYQLIVTFKNTCKHIFCGFAILNCGVRRARFPRFPRNC